MFTMCSLLFFFFSSRRRHTRYWRDWSSDVCSSDLSDYVGYELRAGQVAEKVAKGFCYTFEDIRSSPGGLSGAFSSFFNDAAGRLAGGLTTSPVLQEERYRHGGIKVVSPIGCKGMGPTPKLFTYYRRDLSSTDASRGVLGRAV